MASIVKYTGLMLLAVILIAVGVLYYSHTKETGKPGLTAKRSQSIEEVSEQYNISFSFNGDRSQLIDLIKGKVELNLIYPGSSKFTAKLIQADGTLISVLADQYGPYNEKQIVIIPETGAYLLDVKTKGEWSLNKD